MKRPIATYTKITSRHGDSAPGSQYGKHIGTDYATPVGTVVVAPVSGTIATQGLSSAVGNYIELDGDDGRRHRVLHLSKREVANGTRVAEGERIGLSGNTGSTSTGPHLHWDARKGGTAFGSGFQNFYDTEALYQEASKPKPTPSSGKRLYFDPIGQTATFYPVKGGEYKMKIADPSFNWSVLEDQGYRVRVNSKSAGGDCWVYIIYQNGAQKGQRIPGRQVK